MKLNKLKIMSLKKTVVTIFFMLFIVVLFPSTFDAKYYHDLGWNMVTWDYNTIDDNHYCSGAYNSDNTPYLGYGFLHRDGWDDLTSHARNNCSTDSYFKVQAESKDGGGQFVEGDYVTKNHTSNATQGAARGTDYASWDMET